MTGHIGLRTLTVGSLPLLVIAAPSSGPGARIAEAAAEHGLEPLGGVLGVELPRGARLGFVIDAEELRLRDDRDTTLLRAPRSGVDGDWLAGARRLRGTMTVVARDVDLGPHTPVAEILSVLEAAAGRGEVLGAIVGLAEERPTLPLLFG